MVPQRPEAGEYTPFQSNYIALVPEDEVMGVLDSQLAIVEQLAQKASPAKETFRYAPEKWSVRQVFGHIADAERIFGYRALCIARGQKEPLPPFDENLFVETASFEFQPLPSLVSEFLLLRQANLSLLRSLDATAWTRTCVANGAATSTRAVAWIMAGHLRHHLVILNERYGLR